MNHTKKALFVGPYPPPIDGHSFAFQTIYDNYTYPKYIINQNFKNQKFKLLSAITILFSYFKFFLRKDIDVLYLAGSRSVFGSLKDIILIRLFALRKTRIILHIHAANFDVFIESLHPFIKKIFLRSYEKVNIFISLLDEMQKEYEQFSHTAKIYTVENFYDQAFDEIIDCQPQKNDDIINLVYFSNLIYSKGILILLDAFNILSTKYSNIRLTIAGEYSYDSSMDAVMIKKTVEKILAENKKINYLGSVYGKAKMDLLLTSDIFILPSFYSSEAFPISILEAMRCGCCIITTTHHYLSNIVLEKNGICVEPKSVQAVETAVEYYINNPEILEIIKKYNVNYTKEKFSQQNYVNKLTNIIHNS